MTDYKSETVDGKCIFCEIVNGNIQTPGVFYEDESFMAFLSIFPSTEGHTVVIPKAHFPSDVLSLPDEKLQEFIVAAKKVSNILLNHFDDVGRVGLIMEGTGVDHAHIKLVPMHGTEHMKQGVWKQYLSNKHEFFTKYEGYIVSNDGPKGDIEKLKSLANQLKKSQ